MFKSKEKLKKEILLKLENRLLFGIDLSEGYLELITYNQLSKKVESDFYDNIKDQDFLDKLHERRRKDTLKAFDNIYNDVTINEIKDKDTAVMSFEQVGNKFKVNYDVSTNLVTRLDEEEFISKYINLYSLDKRVYEIDDKIIDISKREPMVKGSNIVFLDNQNYVKELHLNGNFVCSRELPGIKEMKDYQENKNGGKRV